MWNFFASLSGIIGASVSAPIAGLASLAGSEWSLRYAFLLFVIATVCAIRLPAAVDSSEGEGVLRMRGESGGMKASGGRAPVRVRTANGGGGDHIPARNGPGDTPKLATQPSDPSL